MAGAIETTFDAGWEVVPAIEVRAAPGSILADAAIRTYWEELEREILGGMGRGLDGLFFVLHGAMVSESFDDVEGEILERTRRLTGGGAVYVPSTNKLLWPAAMRFEILCREKETFLWRLT